MAQQETELQNSTKLTAGTTYHTFTDQGIFLLASHSQRKLKDRLSLKYASLIPETCFIGHVSRPPKATLSRNLPLKTIYSPWTGQKTLIKIYLNLLEMLNFTSFILHTFLNSEASFFFSYHLEFDNRISSNQSSLIQLCSTTTTEHQTCHPWLWSTAGLQVYQSLRNPPSLKSKRPSVNFPKAGSY